MMAYGHIEACGAEKCVYLWGARALSISILDFLRQPWTKYLELTSNLRLLPCRTSTLNRKISFTNKAMAMRFLALERGQSVQQSRFLAKIYMLGPYFAQKMGLKFGYFSSKEVV